MKWQEIPCPVSRLTIESEVVDLRLSLWMVGTTNSLANGTSCLHPRYSLANPWCHLEAASTKWYLERMDINSRKLTGTGACLFSWVFLSSFLPITSSVQLLSHVWLFATPWTTACQASLSITNSWSLPKLMSIESVMPSNHLILWCPLLLPPSIFPSIRIFSNESAVPIRWPKYWSFSFNISPSNEHPGLISFRMDSLDLLAVQGTLKSLLQHHSFCL